MRFLKHFVVKNNTKNFLIETAYTCTGHTIKKLDCLVNFTNLPILNIYVYQQASTTCCQK